jgi:hypothetical protein
MANTIFQDPRFDALRNAIYHTARGRWLHTVNRFLNFLVIVLGAAAVGKIAEVYIVQEYWIEGAIVIVATIQLVFDFGGRAATHVFLQKRYYDLLSEMEVVVNIESATARRKWSSRLLTIAGDEPIPMLALDAVAYNAALNARIYDPVELEKCQLHIPLWKRLLKHFFTFQGSTFLPRDKNKGVIARIERWWGNGKEKK